jgi:hypothetical protein
MIIRKTIKTKVKKIFRGKNENYKENALYRVVTYWFIFIPVYQCEQFID